MSIAIKEYTNVGEFMKSIDDMIAEYRRRLGEMLRKLEELRVKSEQEKKLKNILSKLGLPESSPSNEIEMRNVRVIVNPTPTQELSSIEIAVEALNNRITLLTAIRKELEILSGIEVGARIVAIFVDDIPRTVALKLS